MCMSDGKHGARVSSLLSNVFNGLRWIVVAVGVGLLGMYLLEQRWGDATQFFLSAVVSVLLLWYVFRRWTRRPS
jgi:hypothetical protein